MHSIFTLEYLMKVFQHTLNSESLTAQVSFAIYAMLLFLKQFSQRKKVIKELLSLGLRYKLHLATPGI